MTKKKLTPPDLKRCQSEHWTGSFMTFGPRDLVRCENIPVWIATEKKKGKDNLKGSMSLCKKCAGIMQKQLGKNFATLDVIQPEH